MLQYSTEQLASVIALPIVTVLLIWTVAIFQRNHRHWSPADIPLVALLVVAILRNISILGYFIVRALQVSNPAYCSAATWTFHSLHTFQASALTTLALIGLFAVRLQRKRRPLAHFLPSAHLLYHLCCLTTLCACVGVAALLAQADQPTCNFMPLDLDTKYRLFVVVLNAFLATVSGIALCALCINHHKLKRANFEYPHHQSSSDLSDLGPHLANHAFYDTYTIQRGKPTQPIAYYDPHHNNNNILWNSDVSNISTTVSSTNSRRPCLGAPQKLQEDRIGLETIVPVLIICYFIYHLPLIILCIYPNLVSPWPIADVALWLGLLQDLLIPIGLSIVDSRFTKWVSNVYRCSEKHGGDKLPHVGLSGKFRPFSSHGAEPHQLRSLQAMEHRFPITNGSLYTSIDGRLPVIHNYRRPKERTLCKTGLGPQFCHHCQSCQTDSCPSHSNLHHLSHKQLNSLISAPPFLQQHPGKDNGGGLYLNQEVPTNSVLKNSRNLVRLNRMRLCKSEDSLHQRKESKNEQILDYSSDDLTDADDNNVNFDSLSSASSFSITTEANCDFEFFQSDQQKNEISRANSRRSLEALGVRMETPKVHRVQRSNSYMTLEDRMRRNNKRLLRSDSKLSDCTHNIRNKVKSVEYLPSSNASTVYLEDVFYFNYPNSRRTHVGSVPDLKKVFISEYI